MNVAEMTYLVSGGT